MEPKWPSLISEYVEQCLDALSDSPLAGKISIGDAVGLMHYHAYRVTYDIDAWWEANTTSREKQQVSVPDLKRISWRHYGICK